MTLVAPDELKACATRILANAGVPEIDAECIADCLVFAERRGTATHGIVRLSHYVERLQAGGINPHPEIRIVRQSGATALVDGDNGFGAVVATYAMKQAVAQADEFGAGVVVVRNHNHFGAAGYYALIAGAHDMIGIATGNVPALMAPTGAHQPMIGNNPLAIAFPSREEPPIVWDSAMSKSSWGALALAAQRNELLPEGAFLAADGTATRDPATVIAGGSLVPFGGYKGYGLALCLGLLSGVLASSPFDADIPHPYREIGAPGLNAAVMIAIKTAAFREPEGFIRDVEEVGRAIRSLPTRDPGDRVWLPGQKEAAAEKERAQVGIPLSDQMLAELSDLSTRFGVRLDLDHRPVPPASSREG